MILYAIGSAAQTKVVDTCALTGPNTAWKKLYTNANSKAIQLQLIQEKIKKDSMYHTSEVPLPIPCGFARATQNNLPAEICAVKILFSLQYAKGKTILLDLNKNPEYSPLVSKLNSENIESISYYDGSRAKSIYGYNGASGVFFLATKNKEYIKEIQRLILNKSK
ncbi:hypothetical protein FK004_12030 [Flavobacterium kingsejongi]|uniref:Uncharacterized protein n=1 Tax=Flavobacterium kingsejongi TaxID=1678728 RepID=A0A2S1LQ71_9FLAO|nr:hypothetical protein FK004_12030 [Flavobacterium kingsejongi]